MCCAVSLVVVVIRERRADGNAHFHAVVESHQCCEALKERHALPSQWLCSRSQLWPSLRRTHPTSHRKPVVDAHPPVWREDKAIGLKELSRDPFVAEAWPKRCDVAEVRAAIKEAMHAELVNANAMLL